MKKSTSLLLSGLLVSGMVLGTVVTPATVVNASDTNEEVAKVANLIKYTDVDGNAIDNVPAQNVNQPVGSDITLPEGYSLYPGLDQKAVVKADGTTQTFKIVKTDQIVSPTVNYIDATTSAQVGSTTVTGVIGQKVAVPAPTDATAKGYTLSDKDATLTLQKDVDKYSVNVTKNITNTIIFKTAAGEQVGTATATGTKVGDVVDLSSQLPTGYTADNAKVTLQYNGNTQIVTVVKSVDGITPFKSVITATASPYTQLYTVDGKKASRALVAGTDWQTNNKMLLDGVTYYQVSTTEWVKEGDLKIKSVDDTDDTTTDAVKADKTVVTTNSDKAFVNLYTKEGKVLENRGLAANTDWQTDLMITVNGAKMYRVATNEWVKASDLK